MKFTKKGILAAGLSLTLLIGSLPVFAQEHISSTETQTVTEQMENSDSNGVKSESNTASSSQKEDVGIVVDQKDPANIANSSDADPSESSDEVDQNEISPTVGDVVPDAEEAAPDAEEAAPDAEEAAPDAEEAAPDAEDKVPDAEVVTSDAEKTMEIKESFSETDVSFDNGAGDYNDQEMTVDDASVTEADIDVEDTPAPESRAANTAPVAGLVYVILNPESLVNGQVSTETQIAWLWSYNGENYTYDPDGDAITNISIGGIPSSSVIGNISGNIGFATQFATPGQYQMTYQVTDARGAKSNVLKFIFNVEPVAGNTRPIVQAIFTPQSGEVYVNSPSAIISWKHSYDNDAGDYIADVRGLVYKNGNGTSENISEYIASINPDEKYLQLSFPSTGIYEVWFSVSDSHGAWSDWALDTYIVSNRPTPEIVELKYGHMMEGLWFDYPRSIELAESGETTETILQMLETYLETPFDCRVGGEDQITGRITYPDGSPAVNAKVVLNMPVPNANPLVYVTTTDSTGYFDMSWTINEYYASLYGRLYRPGKTNGRYGKWAHAAFNFTTFISPTELTISCEGATKTVPVSAVTGVAPFIMVGEDRPLY